MKPCKACTTRLSAREYVEKAIGKNNKSFANGNAKLKAIIMRMTIMDLADRIDELESFTGIVKPSTTPA